MNLLSNNIKKRAERGREITYDYLVDMILSGIKQGIDDGTITSIHDALINSYGSFSPKLVLPIIAESYSMKPLENSKVHNWEDDELITKELLQTIEDKLRISLTKTDLLNYLFLAYFTGREETPEENPFDPFVASLGTGMQGEHPREIGQLKTYFIGEVKDAFTSNAPKEEPFYFITNTSSGGLWEPRGLMEIYMLPTSDKSQLDDLEFEMDYRYNGSKLDPENISFTSPMIQDLIAYCYLKSPKESKISQKLKLPLTYSSETGLYTGVNNDVACTYGYTCSFDPKVGKFTVSIGRPEHDAHFNSVLGREIVGVSIQSKDQSYIPANYGSYYLDDVPYKKYIYRQYAYESKITNGYSYTLIEN